MASLKNKKYIPIIIISLMFALLSICSFAKPLKLLTKQSTYNVRFFSNDNRFSISQARSGTLMLSTNYKVHTLLNGPAGTNYSVLGTPSQKKLVITKSNHYHTFLGIRNLLEIYITNWRSKEKPTLIGRGISPALHQDDSILSYYNPFNKTIYFHNIKNMVLKFKLKLANTTAPYFIPSVIIRNDGTIIYTDINEKGITGVMMWDRGPNNYKNLWKAGTINDRVELCKNSKHIYILKKTLQNNLQTKIIQLNSLFKKIDEAEIIYSSDNADIGNIICSIDRKLFFIKETTPGRQEAVILNLEDKKIEILTNLKSVSQIIDIDGTVIVPHYGENYVVYGNNDFKKDILKKND